MPDTIADTINKFPQMAKSEIPFWVNVYDVDGHRPFGVLRHPSRIVAELSVSWNRRVVYRIKVIPKVQK